MIIVILSFKSYSCFKEYCKNNTVFNFLYSFFIVSVLNVLLLHENINVRCFFVQRKKSMRCIVYVSVKQCSLIILL